MDSALTLVLWSLGRLRSEELPIVAGEWLSKGLDSASLRLLAGETSPIMSDAGPLFEKCLAELGFVAPNKNEALLALAKHCAQEIVDGNVTPYEGAGRICREVASQMDHPSPLFLSFVGAASELDDVPERSFDDGVDRSGYVRELDDSIIVSAKEMLGGANQC